MWLTAFAGFFAFILVAGYLLPAGQFYFRYYIRKVAGREYRIQDREPVRGQIWREVRMSLVSVAIFAALGTLLYYLYLAGMTGIYWDIHEYPWYYLPVSLLLCLVLFDTYFYWTHRFMHWRPVFKYVHAGHHRSVTPTPWAIFAFQPIEALLQGIGIMMLVVFVPMHPIVFLVFLWIDTVVNTAGHTGFELVPRVVSRNWLYSGFNTVRHHDSHHTNMRYNFGSFFNIWDRWMGTFLDDDAAQAPAGCAARSSAIEATEAVEECAERVAGYDADSERRVPSESTRPRSFDVDDQTKPHPHGDSQPGGAGSNRLDWGRRPAPHAPNDRRAGVAGKPVSGH